MMWEIRLMFRKIFLYIRVLIIYENLNKIMEAFDRTNKLEDAESQENYISAMMKEDPDPTKSNIM